MVSVRVVQISLGQSLWSALHLEEEMEQIQPFISLINSYAWGVPMLVLILGTGLFLSVGLKFMSIARIPFGFRLLWKGRILSEDAGEISPFNALMAVPNLIALIVLSPIVFKITKEFFDSRGESEQNPF